MYEYHVPFCITYRLFVGHFGDNARMLPNNVRIVRGDVCNRKLEPGARRMRADYSQERHLPGVDANVALRTLESHNSDTILTLE